MPEVDVLHVHDCEGSVIIEKPDGSVLLDALDDFDLEAMERIGNEHGVVRWSERGDDLPDADESLVVIGWAESPISRDDVQLSYHQGYEHKPMVRVKVDGFELPDGDAFAELVAEHELDNRLAGLPLPELRSLIEKQLESDSERFNDACRGGFESAEEDAAALFEGHNVKCWQAGRSGGWLVVEGLPEVSTWDVKLLTAWQQFEKWCRELVDDIPRQMAWLVLANAQNELAGRVMRVELTFVLSDTDIEEAGTDPRDWDWRGMLQVGDDTTIEVRDLKGKDA